MCRLRIHLNPLLNSSRLTFIMRAIDVDLIDDRAVVVSMGVNYVNYFHIIVFDIDLEDGRFYIETVRDGVVSCCWHDADI